MIPLRLHSRRSVIVAPVLCTALLFASCGERKHAPGSEESPPDTTIRGSTPFPADHPLPAPEQLPVSRKVHTVIAGNTNHPGAEEEMETYDLTAERVPGASLRMVAIPAGEFVFGSDRAGEGPPRRVRIVPFWISATELTWEFFTAYAGGTAGRGPFSPDEIAALPAVDVVSQPSAPAAAGIDLLLAGDFSGALDHPAMSITHHAASKFCQWLSAQTGHFYRLPTEAEWEYACRAGATTTFHHGDSPAELAACAWIASNSDGTYHRVGKKEPNAWGLYDMHGNVAEWVLDGFDPSWRVELGEGTVNPWQIPLTRYPRTVKGGSWDHGPDEARVTSRMPSDPAWKEHDPMRPKSIWYHTDAHWLGFRVVRPLNVPEAEKMEELWNLGLTGE